MPPPDQNPSTHLPLPLLGCPGSGLRAPSLSAFLERVFTLDADLPVQGKASLKPYSVIVDEIDGAKSETTNRSTSKDEVTAHIICEVFLPFVKKLGRSWLRYSEVEEVKNAVKPIHLRRRGITASRMVLPAGSFPRKR